MDFTLQQRNTYRAFTVIFSHKMSNGSQVETGLTTVATRDLPTLFPFDLSVFKAGPHARASPRPACRSGKHDGPASHFPGYPPPFSTLIRRLLSARIHARLHRDFPIGHCHNSASVFNLLDWNPD
ncbi:hypothetical protein [Burkholderia lata]|uniref:hypothetical protein n=1 Tax=Burkholderia lata (strain ATCC 17760 / DSM 23089 / LMG 22485 / NCIMB 9086 / R18194 / 383) TaxID=482957 RepID=UPI0015824E46|nr:hypothetical protein [Burkholderia lata]